MDLVISLPLSVSSGRGFGFVTFRDPKNVQSVLDATTPHTLDGRTVRPCFFTFVCVLFFFFARIESVIRVC